MMAYPLVWRPTYDKSYSKDPFFKHDPVTSIAQGHFNRVPTMIGSLKDEGLLNTATMLQDPGLLEYFKTHWEECAANSFLQTFFLKEIDVKTRKKIAAIEDFYLQGQKIWKNHWTFQNLSKIFADTKFFYGSDKMAQDLSRHNAKTFYYQFDHLGSFSISDILSSSRPSLIWTLLKKLVGIHDSKKLGVCHADDLLYLFKYY